MKPMHLLEAFGEIDDRFLTEAEEYTRKPSKLVLRWLSAAACLVVAVTGGILYTQLNGIKPDSTANQSGSAQSAAAQDPTSKAAAEAAPEIAPFAAPPAGENAEDAADALPGQGNRLAGDAPSSAKLEAVCELDGLRYAAVTDVSLLEGAGLPAAPSPDDRGDLLGEQDMGQIYAYAPLAEVPAVRLLQDGESLRFLLCCGVDDGRTLGALFAFDGSGVSALLGEEALLEEAGTLLAALTPAQEELPAGEAVSCLSLTLPNGLTVRLGWYPAESLLVLGDTAYAAEGKLASLLAEAAS